MVIREPSLEFAVDLVEQFETLMQSLGDKELMQVASWKLEGYSNEEIALKVNRSARTEVGKGNLFRTIWIQKQLTDE